MQLIKKISALRHKNVKILFYLKGFLRLLFVPDWFCRLALSRKLSTLKKFDEEYVFSRVNYYNKLKTGKELGDAPMALKDFKVGDHKSAYFFDAYQYTRFFSKNLKGNFLFGDITYIPSFPSLLKSRPIQGDNTNSVLLNLNKIRHFNFIHDVRNFGDKKNKLVWRGHVYDQKPKRIKFLEKYADHPLCNVGYTNNWGKNTGWAKGKMSIEEQLEYKFILCIEGIDVASNLKWVMSSNSLPVMPKPQYETWFMEGTLIPGVHYVEIKDDFSDLEEQMNYYLSNPSEAMKIIQNGHDFVDQFKNRKQENLISLMVLDKYFQKTNK